MSIFKFELPTDFISQLHNKLESLRKKRNSEDSQIFNRPLGRFVGGLAFQQHPQNLELYPPANIPSENILSQIIGTCFWTSLEREEGRPLSFSISYEKYIEDDIPWLTFNPYLSFDVPTLVKLAPAIGTNAAVQIWSENNKLKIWGRRDSESNYFSVRVLDPGQIVVKLFNEPIAILSGAEFFLIKDSLLGRYGSMWDKLSDEETNSKSNEFFGIKRQALIQTIKQMRQFGHGGTLIIVNKNSSFMESIEHVRYRLTKAYSDLQFNLGYYLDNLDEKKNESLQMNQAIQEAAKDLATLTCVDGAVILDKSLAVIGFGAKLKPSNDTPFDKFIVKIDPFDHQEQIQIIKRLEDLGGTRHQSAARFAIDNKDAIAIVVSQDGTVSTFVWEVLESNENKDGKLERLFAYRRLEATLF